MASFSDDFNRADSSDLGAGWVEVSGDWSIVSQQLSPGAAGGTIILRAAGAMDTDDNYAQVTIAATVAASQGVWCRGNSNISSGYLWRNDGSTWDLFSVVGGSFTAIGSYAAAAAPGDVAKVQAVGSTIKALVNGVERVSLTNTHVVTGTSVGIRSESAGALRFDDFAAADVTAGVVLEAALETDEAQSLAGAKSATLTAAAEAAAAQPLSGAKAATLGGAAAVESALLLSGAKASVLSPAVGQEAAQALSGTVSAVLGVAGAVEVALPLTGVKTAVLAPAVEMDAARALSAVSVTAPSLERTYQVPAERRVFAVVAEDRTLIVR
ncbi:hypothetical protein [Streptomyces stelliscabiei]|uniref:Uncharacterized protein n=1 Tax=Streptomyces stelliscabiei TaxID=146820 RepID=A0A8I0TR90_9ACTN|nr:hypothetical protein [Streptomyces stelliscabiei]KND45419.1 hypothetical protein IQ64_07170 [Streptomyces stelliscabiei]MBE1597247.1 hypothetical protein [Streptomyces stelliscabiei]